jgi:hypothetical protein
VGATGDCVLYVDGAEADRSAGMWVDAGDSVACVLNHRFETPGTHTVDVAVQGIAPTDDDATNDRRSGSIQVGHPAVPMRYQVLASNDHQNWSFHEEDYYRAASDAYFDQPDYSTTESYAGDHQLVSLHAWTTEQALSFPISVDFRASTDGGLVSAYRLDGLTGSVTTYSDGGSFSAVSWYDSDTDSNEHLLVQIVKSADGYRYTDAQAWRNAGFVQFWGHTYCRAWLCGSPYDYAWSSATYDPMPMRPMGSTYTFDVTLNDASTAVTTTATVTLVPYDNSSYTPYQCAPEIDLGTGYFSRYCSELRTSQTGAWGTATGP